MRTTAFKVQGRGEFPAYMLRADGAWPQASTDADLIADGRERRTIRLATAEPMAPDFDRWSAAGWAVVGVTR